MKESQLLKGVLEGCVLEIISKKSIYGYELIQSLKETGFDKIVAGTVYPLLQKLEKQGVIVGEMRPSPDGPDPILGQRPIFMMMKHSVNSSTIWFVT